MTSQEPIPQTDVYLTLMRAAIAARSLFLRYKNSIGRFDPPVKLTATREAGWALGAVRKGLIDVVSDAIGKPVDVQEVTLGGSTVQAYVKSYPLKALIYVIDGHNFCWQRFLVAKEICHLLCKNDHNSTSTAEHVERVLDDLINGNFDGVTDPAVIMENAAYIGAVELLLPRELEEEAMQMLKKDQDSYAVALKMRVPQRIVEFRYLGQGVDIFKRIYSESAYKHVEFKPVMN